MASIFEQTIVPKVKFSNFNLSETSILTCNFGQLVPCYLREVIPNDVFTMSVFADIQFAPMVAPMFQDVNCSIHFFYYPNRIVWDDFETFITGAQEGHVLSEDKLPAPAGVHPYWFATAVGSESMQGSIFDYLGLPNELGSVDFDDTDDVISDIPLRGYFKIWYDYYRDENLQYELNRRGTGAIDLFAMWRAWRASSTYLMDNPTDPSSGGSVIANVWSDFSPFHRAYRKNYFTAALPTPQKGEPVTLNLGTTAPVNLADDNIVRLGSSDPDEASVSLYSRVGAFGDMSFLSARPDSGAVAQMVFSAGDDTMLPVDAFIGRLHNAHNDPSSYPIAYADLSRASSITVEALREAFAVQEILESLSMRGSRYTEFLKGNFGVTPDDYKLQRPQFLGGVVTPVQVQQVLQNAGVDSSQGQMTAYAAGRAYAAAGDRVFRMRFKEHGYIMGILSVMPKDYYFQGIPRHFTRRDRFDYYIPQTAHLGEQAILNQELYFDGSDRDKNNAVFGYIPRWAEYKTATNSIHGDFRGSLNYYHMARIFGTTPTLSENFILTKDVQTRPFGIWKEARPNVNHLIWCNLFFKVTASRPMPYHSVPKVI